MPRIISDNDVRGQFGVLVGICCSHAWSSIWKELGCEVLRFEAIGLCDDASDLDIWRACQANEAVLVTGNRSSNEPSSLEETIRSFGDDRSLPVLTIGRPIEVLRDRKYAEAAAERLLEVLIDLDDYRGAGRLFLP